MSRLQPRLKSSTASNATSQPSSANKETILRPDTSLPRPSPQAASADATSDRATLFLIRRTLCSRRGDKGGNTSAPIDEILPPLTSSNEVDLQLYAFIAIIIREFVQTWYNKITPDQIFVEEVVKIIAHCTRGLEQRLRKVDLESLLFDELPELLEAHVQAYHASHRPIHPPPFQTHSRQIYHSLWPFPALSPVPDDEFKLQEQVANESAYRQLLIQGALSILLPTEDLENDCLTSIVGQIFAEMILGDGIGGKASEPWLLWEGITKITEAVKAQMPKSKAQVRVERSNSGSGVAVQLDLTGGGTRRLRIGKSIQKSFWLVLQYGFLAFNAIRFFIVTLATAPSLPSRIAPTMNITGGLSTNEHKNQPQLTNSPETVLDGKRLLSKQPILKLKIWSCVASILDLDARMPWLSATLSMLQWAALIGPGGLGKMDGMIDKILSHAIQTHVLDPILLPQLLRVARAALFPNNIPAPPRIVPSASEQLAIRRRCAESFLDLIPSRVQDVYFGVEKERRVSEVEEALDVFGDGYCNKHLLYGVTELIIVRLMPEMAEKGVEKLLEERLS